MAALVSIADYGDSDSDDSELESNPTSTSRGGKYTVRSETTLDSPRRSSYEPQSCTNSDRNSSIENRRTSSGETECSRGSTSRNESNRTYSGVKPDLPTKKYKHERRKALPRPKMNKTVSQSVFDNPFDKAKRAKDSILEKHVKMTSTVDSSKSKQKQFGKNKRGKGRGNANCSNRNPGDDDSYMANFQRKRRCGVSDQLIPPKRALEQLSKQRINERPWTVSQTS